MTWEHADYDELLWILLYPESVPALREEVEAELVRRLKTCEAMKRAIKERLMIGVPLGLLSDWKPTWLKD